MNARPISDSHCESALYGCFVLAGIAFTVLGLGAFGIAWLLS
jgi:hypothetical protein